MCIVEYEGELERHFLPFTGNHTSFFYASIFSSKVRKSVKCQEVELVIVSAMLV